MKSLREYIDLVDEREQLDEIHLGDIPGMAMKAWNAWNFLKQHGIPLIMFAAVASLHGLSKAIEATQSGEANFNRIARAAMKKMNSDKVADLAEKLNNWFVKLSQKIDDPLDMGDNVGGIIRDLAESRRTK
jgi:hypothetical protein